MREREEIYHRKYGNSLEFLNGKKNSKNFELLSIFLRLFFFEYFKGEINRLYFLKVFQIRSIIEEIQKQYN